ncbi:MAG: hypothetical protein JW957_05050 [Candidatus Omnitrophica bacterium]|nr:hypothetical protein [Candidatus Omnitrophota bacterium]
MEDKEKREGFAVIQEEWAPVIKVPELANALATTLDILFADALFLAGQTKGIVCRRTAKEKAEELVTKLKGMGVSSFIVPESCLIEIPKALNITKIACLPDTLTVFLDSSNKTYTAKWNDIITISCGYVKQVSTGQDSSLSENFMGILGAHIPYLPVRAAAFPMAIWKWHTESKPDKTVKYLLLMDIITRNPVARFRVESRRFAYTKLGQEMKLDTLSNFKELIKEIISHLPQTCLKKDIEIFLGEEDRHQKAAFKSHEEFDRYNAWLVQKASHQLKQSEEKA